MTLGLLMLMVGVPLLVSGFKDLSVREILTGERQPGKNPTDFLARLNAMDNGGSSGNSPAAVAGQIASANEPAAPGGPQGARGPSGVGTFDGMRVAKWIIPQLEYARAHGWTGHITSGYRPGFDSHTKSGKSEHQGTQYPRGAIDFGGFVDAPGLANRQAFLDASKGYKGPHLLKPIGFRDDGHLSGVGH